MILQAHEDMVEDVAWHLKDDNLFGSVGDDCKLMIWDLRTNKAEQSVVAHQKEVSMLDSSVAELNVYLCLETAEVLQLVLCSVLNSRAQDLFFMYLGVARGAFFLMLQGYTPDIWFLSVVISTKCFFLSLEIISLQFLLFLSLLF
jgi:WD40 repeat protein